MSNWLDKARTMKRPADDQGTSSPKTKKPRMKPKRAKKVDPSELGLDKPSLNFLPEDEAKKLEQELESSTFERPILPRFNVRIPRGQCLKIFDPKFKDASYKYSGIIVNGTLVDENSVLAKLHREVEKVAKRKLPYALINQYLTEGDDNKEDCVHFHRDEREAKDGTDIYSYSIGGVRMFKVKSDPKKMPELKTCSIELQSNSLLVISHKTNSTCFHAVERSTETEKTKLGDSRKKTRYNITFREYLS